MKIYLSRIGKISFLVAIFFCFSPLIAYFFVPLPKIENLQYEIGQFSVFLPFYDSFEDHSLPVFFCFCFYSRIRHSGSIYENAVLLPRWKFYC